MLSRCCVDEAQALGCGTYDRLVETSVWALCALSSLCIISWYAAPIVGVLAGQYCAPVRGLEIIAVVEQELRLDAVRARICSPAFARAAHAIVQSHAAAVPSLPRPTLRAVGAALAAMAPRLQFVAACHARTVLRDSGADVSRDGTALQARSHLIKTLRFAADRTSHCASCKCANSTSRMTYVYKF